MFERLSCDLTIITDGEDHNKFFILKDRLLVIPLSMQRQIVKLAHEGHQGLVKTKQLLRQKVWFIGSSKLVEEICRSCLPCQAATHGGTEKGEVHPTELSSNCWENLCIDFVGPFPNEMYLLVTIDEYSHYPVVQIVRSTSALSTTKKLYDIFSLFGIPLVLKSDEGPPFQSEKFRSFCKSLRIKHKRITPCHPPANGTAEHFMRTLEKSTQSAITENLNWTTKLQKFLRNY